MTVNTRLDAAAYARAESLLGANRGKLTPRASVRPQWIDGGSRFWYRVKTGPGFEFVLVDPAERSRTAAFDHGRLAAALAAAAESEVAAAKLPFAAIEFTSDAVEFHALARRWRVSLDSYACEELSASLQEPLDAVSPDKSRSVFQHDHNLWLRDLSTGDTTQLTFDGETDYAYGSQPDSGSPFTLLRRLGLSHPPPVVAWSPDSTRILTHRTDQRLVEIMPLVESNPAGGGRPILRNKRYALPGDPALPLGEILTIDVATASVVNAVTDPILIPYMSPITFSALWWSKDGSAVYFTEQSRDMKTLSLKRLDPQSGEVRTLVEEHGGTRVEAAQSLLQKPMIRVLDASNEFIWYSQRDGWGHLYLYGADGELVTQLTSGEWPVQEILHVDEDARVLYFIASGLIEGSPYRRQICRVGLDGADFSRLGDDELDHVATVAENGEYFVDSASTVDTPAVTTVRGWAGEVVVELERADIEPLLDAGWTAPEEFKVTAADGVTDIYGVLYKPAGFDPSKSYAVVDHPYPGPQINRLMPSFDAGFYGYEAEAVAALGFVVVVIDGRGTPGRSKAFHDESYGHLADAGGLVDHVAGIRELAQTRPWMDTNRVGIFGLSGGGFATVRALCSFPEFYKVGVAEAGNHENRIYHSLWSESYDGPPDAERYAASANTEIADRLEGKLLLIHGEMDDNVTPHQTMRVVDRLIEANKDFEMLIVPGADHGFTGYGHYVARRRWDFLVRHLMGVEPPSGYRLADIPLSPELEAMGS